MFRPVLFGVLLAGWFAAPVRAADELGLYVIDIETGKLTPLAVEPLAGHTYCGSPAWSADGKHLLFDATPGVQWSKTHMLKTSFPLDDKPAFTDLGPGNCPSLSPDGKRIVFLLNPGAVPDAKPGLWIMNADGTERRRLASGAMPEWSPDGKQVLSITFSNPCDLTLLDADDGAAQEVSLAGHRFYSVPAWADDQTLVAVIRAQGAPSIALIDVSDPAKATVKRVLWIRGSGADVEPTYPVYSAKLKRCAFIGRSAAETALYIIDDKSGGVARLLEPELESEPALARLAGLAISPAGDKLLFGAERKSETP